MVRVGPPLITATAVACLLLGGCGGNPSPAPAPSATTTSSSPSPSASATPSAPVMPEAAGAKTRAGAIAMTRHFMDSVNYAGESGDTTQLRSLYVELCTRCEALADAIDQTYEAGGYFRGGDWKPTKVQVYSIQNEVAVLDSLVSYESQEWVRRKGEAAQTFPASAGNLKSFNLRWVGNNGWRVSALDPNK